MKEDAIDRIEITSERLVDQDLEAVVVANDPLLRNHAGMSAAVAAAAGEHYQQICDQVAQNPVVIGENAVITAGDLQWPCRAVINVVVANRQQDSSGELLEPAYAAVFQTAESYNLRSLAFSALGSEGDNYSCRLDAAIALRTVWEQLGAHPDIEFIRFCLPDPDQLAAFNDQWLQLPGARGTLTPVDLLKMARR